MVPYFVRSLLALSALIGLYSWACPYPIAVTVLTFARHPDVPRHRYAEGRIVPSYARSYLIVAYRYFAGVGFNGGEQAQVLAYWQDRTPERPWDRTAPDWVENWTREAAKVDGIKQDPEQFRRDRNPNSPAYVFYRAEDAYRVATFTLRDRIQRVGVKSPYLRSWLAGQQVAFEEATDWPALPNGSPKWLVQDRADQKAAALFYAGKTEDAARAFREIAADSTSQWRILARYLVARSYVVGAQGDAKFGPQGEAEIRAILSNPALAQIHSVVKVLRRRNALTTDPMAVMDDLAQTVVKPRVDLSLRQDIWDYLHLYDAVEERKPDRQNLDLDPRTTQKPCGTVTRKGAELPRGKVLKRIRTS